MIDKDTLLFGSFSKKAGNVGCTFFNTYFQKNNINAVYKSFSVDNIEKAVDAAKFLSFSGFGVSMPFKSEIVRLLDVISDEVLRLNACNTVVIKENKLYGYNTDYLAVKEYLELYHSKVKRMYILGNGSYSRTVQYCCKDLHIEYEVIKRDRWTLIDHLKESVIFNCTPVENTRVDPSNTYIDCINTTETGSILAKFQALHQYKLYTKEEI